MSSTKVVTGRVRFSFLNVFEPKAIVDGADPKYSGSFIIDKKDKATLKKVEAAIEAAITEGKAKYAWKSDKGLKLPLRDGDEEKDDDAYEGAMFFNASSKTKPGVLNKEGERIMNQEEIYSGCYGRISANFYPFNVNGNKGIAVGLNNLQTFNEGERLSGGSSAEDDFGVEEDGDDLM